MMKKDFPILSMKELNVSIVIIMTDGTEGEEKLNAYTAKSVPFWKLFLAEEGVVRNELI